MITVKKFVPKPDITVEELAEIVAQLPMPAQGYAAGCPSRGVQFVDEVWNRTPEGIRRHFEDA